MKNYKKGFTLIELLVVIAIIGILATVVLGSLSTAREKGQATAVAGDLGNMRAQMELYYGANNNTFAPSGTASGCGTNGTPDYTAGPFSVTATSSVAAQVKAARAKGATVLCYAVPSGWKVQSMLPSGSGWCVDGKGNSVASSTISTTVIAGDSCL